jgi:UDP-3-O-[3-hydroxymyristoyl] N-acetylglucosamine deacetylase
MAGNRKGARQSTLRRSATVTGVGVHGGLPASLTIHPAEAGSGISFRRVNGDDAHAPVRAHYSNVSATELCTAVGMNGSSVATIEHLMATLSALAIDNAIVEIDGPEVPVMDGSAGAFLDALDSAGVALLDAPRSFIKVLRPVRIGRGDSFAEFVPHPTMRIEVEIDFTNPLIGNQRFAADIDAEVFRREIARARTFGFLCDVERLWEKGLAKGASLDNTVVIGDDRVMNPEGLRYADECVRHKALDAVGDLALAGAPILGCYRSHRGGHKLNVMAVEALLAEKGAWALVQDIAPATPERAEVARAGLAPGLAAAAYAPDAS